MLLCGSDPGAAGHIEHVVAVARFAEYAQGFEDFRSATRRACEPCNIAKLDRDPAEFILDRWARGLPVRQAVEVLLVGPGKPRVLGDLADDGQVRLERLLLEACSS